MRKPRDIDAELRALVERTKALKSRKIVQLGEVVMVTGAGELEPEVLTGLLIDALETADDQQRKLWRRKGEGFFLGERRKRSAANAAGQPAAPGAEARSAGPAAGSGQGSV
jgi:hypothetical protein